MKIARLETFANPFVGFVRVTTDTGDEGWGQLSTYLRVMGAKVPSIYGPSADEPW